MSGDRIAEISERRIDDDRVGLGTMILSPITLAQAREFVRAHHRHSRPPVGWKFGVGLRETMSGPLIGVATAGRPISRMLDDGWTLEVNRTCTDGTPNANSKLYGAIWRAAKALGYSRCITYTQAEESGASLRAAGWVVDCVLPPRSGWSTPSRPRSDIGSGGKPRLRWAIISDRHSYEPSKRPS